MSRLHVRMRDGVVGAAGSLLLLLTLLGTPAGAAQQGGSPSGATETPTWSFVPLSHSANFLSRSSIHLVAGPGQTVADTAVLTNYSDQQLQFDVYGSDAYNTLRLGALTVNPPNVAAVGVGSWIHVAVNNYALPPRSTAAFHFSVRVPANASPGDHAGGIVALNKTTASNPQPGVNFKVQRGSAIAVYVRVPGPLHAGVAAANIGALYSNPPLGFGSSWARVHYQIVNTGNVVLNGKSQVVVTDMFGSTVHRFKPVPIVALLPGARMDVVEPKWSGLPFIGPVHLKVIMTTTAAKATGEAQFWVIPWLLILIVIVVLLLLFLWWRRRRRQRRDEAQPVGETAGSAAEQSEGAVPAQVP